jgi:hypothetical protein
MKASSDYLYHIYSPIQKKTFEAVLSNFIEKELPQIGGPMIVRLFVDKLKDLIEQYYPVHSRLKMGQILWFAVAKDEHHSYGKSMEKTRIVPVVLTLITHEDIEKMIGGVSLRSIKKDIAARLYQETDSQGGTLAETDISLILLVSLTMVRKYTREFEQENSCVLPRRGTIHDMGSSLSHKADICKKIKVDNKSIHSVSLETNHTPEAISRYLTNLERVKFCLKKRLDVNSTSFVTAISKMLVLEYKQLSEEIEDMKNDAEIKDDLPF